MRPKRFFYIMVGGLVLCAALIIGAVFGGNVMLKEKSSVLYDLKLQNRVVQEQQKSLVRAKNDIEKYTELDAIARTIVPQDKDQAKTVREISAIAAQNGIRLEAITFGASNLGQAVAPKPTPITGEQAPATPSEPAVTIPSQAKAVSGIPGVYALEVSVSSVEEQPVEYRKFLDFLAALEGNRRTAHVERISITPSKDRKAVSFDLTLNAYLKP